MITIQNAESALKNIYLDAIISDINTKTNPFLTMVQKNSKQVAGKDIRIPIRKISEKSVSIGTEGGDLPIYVDGKQFEINVPLKNLYGSFQISDKAIRSACNNPGAFASLLSQEMTNLVNTAKSNLNAKIYGCARRYLGYTDSIASNELTVQERFISNFKVGDVFTIMRVDCYTNATSATVSAISGNKITFTGTFTASNQDRYYLYAGTYGSADTSDLNGIDSLYRVDTLYNFVSPTANYKELLPYKTNADFTATAPIEVLNEETILKFFDGYEEHCQGIPADILLTHPTVRRALFEELKSLRTNIDTAELAGGFKGFTFNGIPVYSDVKCKGGTLYAINSDSWAMYQLCDWTWLNGDDGSILKQNDGKASYSAHLVKYCDLICDKPFLQGKISGYSALRAK